MRYRTKLIIASKEYTSETSENTYVRDVEYSDCVSNHVLDIGATGSSSLSVTIVNPESSSYDGEDVELWVSPVEDGIESKAEQIIKEIEDSAGIEVVTSDYIDTDSEEDLGQEGDDMTDAEIEETEEEIKAEQESAFEILEGSNGYTEEITTVGKKEAEWTKIGKFTIYKQYAYNGQIRIICYDKFALMNEEYNPNIDSGTIQDFYNDYCTQLEANGIAIDSEIEMPEGSITWNPSVSYRQAIGYFAGLCGGYADFDNDGELTINQYANSNVELVKSDLISLTGTSGGDINITGFECNGLVSGYIPSMSFRNPLMTQTILDEVYESYKGLRLSGQRFTAMWTPAIHAGTFLRLMSEEEYRSFLMLKNYAEKNGMTTEIMADLNGFGDIVQITSQTVSFSGDAVTQINSELSTATAADNPSIEPVKTTAEKAQEYAEQAQDSADEAATAAANALSKAVEAEISASTASKAAEEAVSKANIADEAASQAQASAGIAQAKAEAATTSATAAGKAASQAQAAAEAAQGDIDEQKSHFWHDSEGAHVLSETVGSRVDIEADGMHILSTVDSTELAKFTKDGAVIGNVNTSHVEQSPRKIAMFDKGQNQYFSAEDLRNQDNIATIIAIEDPAQYATEGGNACDIPLQFTPVQITEVRTRNGYIDARDYHVHVEAEDETVIPYLYIDFSHVFALSKVRITYTTSNELYAFTLGKRAALDDDYPIYGANSFVMGKDNVAFGNYSAAFGNGVRATNPNQFVFGSYNAVPGYDRGDGTTVPDGEYLEIVGNGQGPLTYGTNYYDNARELDTHGNQWISGTMDASGYKIEGESLLDIIYPVGSIIWSSDPDDPRTQIAGMTWTPIKDKFILAAGSTFGTRGSGGNKDAVVVSHSHTLTMDAHSHSFSVPNHTHSLNDSNFLGTSGAALTRKSIKPGSGTAVSNVLISPGAVERKANTASGGGSSNTTGSKTSTGNISTNGSSGTNANMPPYVIKYCWERTS